MNLEGLDARVSAISERVTAHSLRYDEAHRGLELRIRSLEISRAKASGMLIVASAIGSMAGGLAVALIVKLFNH